LMTSQRTLKPMLSLSFVSRLWLPIIRILSRVFSNLTHTSLQLCWMLKVESPLYAIMMEKVCASHNVGIPCGPTPSFRKCYIVM
jgi:hypothetical protein